MTSMIRRWLLFAPLLLLVPSCLGEAAPEASPAAEPVADAEAAATAEALHYYGAPTPYSESVHGAFGGHPHGGNIISGARSLASTHRTHGGEHSHCALLIPGHSKSHFDHAFGGFNDIHHGGDGVTCVTFQSVDAAFAKARDRHGLPRPGKKDDPEQRSELGAVLLEATKILAHEYHLPKDVIVNGLPLIDTHKTIIGTVCSDFTKPRPCKPEKYRTFDGRCNNLHNPTWGSALSTFKRFLLPLYDDGVDRPKFTSKHGYELPSPRVVSAHVHRDEGLHDHAVTIMSVAWGQAIDHDMTLTLETKLPGTTMDPKCCKEDKGFPDCLPISVPREDPFFSLFKQDCISLTRSRPGLTNKCKLGPRTQLNEITSYLDGNWVYGNNADIAKRLRLFKGGLLKALPVFREFGLKDMLPLKLQDPEAGCIRPNNEVYCFDAGDNRVNEQLVLAVIHTLLMREHNRIVIELAKINPHWDDEKLYQEGRHIVAAIIQHITYNEFLPMVLGKDMMQKHGLILQKHGYFDGYNPKVDATVSAQFVTAAFRFGHSLLPSTIERWSPSHKYIASQRLSEMLRQPFDLYKGGWCDHYLMGLCNQVAQAMDDAVSQEVTNHLFQEPNKKFGMDLAAINMQRAREHGVPYYNDFREFCGLPRIHSWTDMSGWMTNKTTHRYSEVYRHPDDIDLWSGGVSEKPLPGSMVGPTFSCLIGMSFKDLRYGDRFWYENPGQPSSFTPHQLEEIRKVKLSRVVCDNSDDIKEVQVYAMVLPDHDINPRVPCNSGVLPRLDLSLWADPHGHHGAGSHPHNIYDHNTLQTLDLPPGTRKHFDNPGGSEGGAGAGPALGLLEQFGNVDSPFDFGGDFDLGKFPAAEPIKTISDASFGQVQSGKPGDSISFGHFESSVQHGDGIVPHGNVFEGGHNNVQYGNVVHDSKHQDFSTGFSDFDIGSFGPVKHDTLLNSGHKNLHHGISGSYGHAPIHPHDVHASGHVSGGGFSHSVSHGSVPYGPQIGHSYGVPPKAYGAPKPIVNHAVVIPLNHGRPHRGRGKGGKGYFKKFMNMFGY